ncbi:MAG: DrmE family protein [Pelagibacteraceae bacterium]|nr:DrmE family protein [Pelagibacteraceae bacterium]MCI5079650.1 DrmE family protein [Pelagibacteraceae bacterium]
MGNANKDIISALPKDYDWIDSINFETFASKEHYSSPPKILKFLLNIIDHFEDQHLSFVLPAKKNISYILSILFALEKIRKNQKNFIDDFENFLKPGTNVIYNLENSEKGKVYKYLGKKEGEEEITVIETLPSRGLDPCRIERKITNLLQFYPTTKNKPVGRRPPKDYLPERNHLDKLLNIDTFNNPFLLRNSIIVLTEKKSINTFFDNQKINGSLLKDFISIAQINEEGDLEKFKKFDSISNDEKKESIKIEPLIIYCHNIYSLYEYLKKHKDTKVILTDTVSKLNNVSILKQIQEINSNHKFITLNDYDDFENLEDFKLKIDHPIWKFEKSELDDWIELDENTIQNNRNYNSFDSNSKIKKYFVNYINKKKTILDIPENIFDKINRKLKILDELVKKSEENSDELIDINYKFRKLKGRVQDYIFGFNDELKNIFEESLKEIASFRKDRQNLFSDQTYDTIVNIENYFKEIDLTNNNFFKNRLKLLKNILEDSQNQFNKSTTTFIVDNPKVKKHYEENIREKFNLDFEINSSFRPRRNFKFALILSELSERRISKILNKNYYKELIFIATPTMKENINKIIDYDNFKWKKFLLDNGIKHKLSKLNNITDNHFNYKEHHQYQNSKEDLTNNVFIQLDNPLLKELKNVEKSEDKLETNYVEFYGDCYSLFSQNTQIKVLNNIFFNSKSRETKSVKELVPEDYVLLRDSSDRDVVESEARILAVENNINYEDLKKYSSLWLELIWEHLKIAENTAASHSNKSKYKKILRKNGYKKSDGTIRNLINNLIICPDDEIDLKILMSSLNEFVGREVITKEEVKKIYISAYNQKNIHRQAGRNISLKISQSLSNEEVIIDREPVRVDYNRDGSISLNSNESNNPEAWIVQVKKVDDDVIYTSKIDSNRLKWIDT